MAVVTIRNDQLEWFLYESDGIVWHFIDTQTSEILTLELDTLDYVDTQNDLFDMPLEAAVANLRQRIEDVKFPEPREIMQAFQIKWQADRYLDLPISKPFLFDYIVMTQFMSEQVQMHPHLKTVLRRAYRHRDNRMFYFEQALQPFTAALKAWLLFKQNEYQSLLETWLVAHGHIVKFE